MTTPDLSALSDAELEAAIVHLGEQAHQWTLAAEVVRAELAGRRVAVDPDKHESWTDQADKALAGAVKAAPARAKRIAAELAEAERVEAERVEAERLERLARQVSAGDTSLELTAEERTAVDAILAKK